MVGTESVSKGVEGNRAAKSVESKEDAGRQGRADGKV